MKKNVFVLMSVLIVAVVSFVVFGVVNARRGPPFDGLVRLSGQQIDDYCQEFGLESGGACKLGVYGLDPEAMRFPADVVTSGFLVLVGKRACLERFTPATAFGIDSEDFEDVDGIDMAVLNSGSIADFFALAVGDDSLRGKWERSTTAMWDREGSTGMAGLHEYRGSRWGSVGVLVVFQMDGMSWDEPTAP